MEPRTLLATLFVNTTADSGPGSLRAAIQLANATPGADSIEFDIDAATIEPVVGGPPSIAVPGFDPATQLWTISLASPLPVVTETLTIDGLSQAETGKAFMYPFQLQPEPIVFFSSPNTITSRDGNDARLRVVIDGGGMDAPGLVLDTSHSNVRGLILHGFRNAIEIPNERNVGNRVQGNAIGAYVTYPVNPLSGERISDVTADVIIRTTNGGHGVLVRATNSAIGGAVPQDANTITGSGNSDPNAVGSGHGVWITASAEGTIVQGNQIGVISVGDSLYLAHPNAGDGVFIDNTSSNAVGGPVAGAGNVISTNLGNGVRIEGNAVFSLATRNRVEANYIGIGPGGDYRFGATAPGNLGDGVLVREAPDNRVGGPGEDQGNVIAANSGAGVRLTGAQTVGTTLLGNHIGLTASGDSVLGNNLEGVTIEGGSARNTIGAGNRISGNRLGVKLTGPGGNAIVDSFIGTDAAGLIDLGNTEEGIRVDNSPGNSISGTAPGALVISGNNIGVAIVGAGSVQNVVSGAHIGTDTSGTHDVSNAQQGVLVQDAARNTIGGATANLISANHWGIELNGPGVLDTLIAGNKIGTDAAGTGSLANEIDGVLIRLGASFNLLGGDDPSAGNIIWFNRRDGIRIEDDSQRNGILGNSISRNTGLGIHLVPPASGAGPNNLQPAPVLTGVRISTDYTRLTGTLTSAPGFYRIQFFANPAPTASLPAEGARYLGETFVEIGELGSAEFLQNVPGLVVAGEQITATATTLPAVLPDKPGDTSEFSPGLEVELGDLRFASRVISWDEGAGLAVVAVDRVGGSGGRATVRYATAGGTALPGVDYTPVSGELVFEEDIDRLTFSVPILEDNLREATETVILVLTDATGGAQLGDPSRAILNILDNDQPGDFSFSPFSYIVAQGADEVVVTVVRSPAGFPASVRYTTAGGTAVAGLDYRFVTGVLDFQQGQSSATFTVPLLFNPAAPAESTIGLVLSDPTNNAGLGDHPTAVVTILRVDAGQIAFAQALYTVAEDAGQVVVTVTRQASPVPVDVRYATAGGSAVPGLDYQPVSGVLSFAPGQETATFTVPILFNPFTRVDTAIGLFLSDPTNGARLGVPSTSAILIVDGSGPTVTSVTAVPGPRGASVFVIGFDRPLIASRAIDLRNFGYSLSVAPPGRRPGSRLDRLVAVRAAAYDPAAFTVRLTTATPIASGRRLLLRINQVTDVPGAGVGVAGLDGRLLDGDGDGRPGGVYQTELVVPRSIRPAVPRGPRMRAFQPARGY